MSCQLNKEKMSSFCQIFLCVVYQQLSIFHTVLQLTDILEIPRGGGKARTYTQYITMIKQSNVYSWIIVGDDRLEKSKLGTEAAWEKGFMCQIERKETKLVLASTPTEKMLRKDKCEER